MTSTRREFLNRNALGLAAAACAGPGAALLHADPLGLPIGCQTFPVREDIGRDFDGTLHKLAGVGYQRIEMCSPPAYAGMGFGPLMKLTGAELRKQIRDAGLGCESCHFGFRELQDHLDERLAFARDLGLSQMVVSTFALPSTATLGDWQKAADQLNRIGEKTQTAGIQLGFHNHDFEFHEIDGVLIYDKLMEALDPKLVKMQFQVSVISLGYKAATYLRKYPGRFLSMHLADWSPADKKTVAVGSGVVDWKDTFEAAKIGGIKNYFVETPSDGYQQSYSYLHSLTV